MTRISPEQFRLPVSVIEVDQLPSMHGNSAPRRGKKGPHTKMPVLPANNRSTTGAGPSGIRPRRTKSGGAGELLKVQKLGAFFSRGKPNSDASASRPHLLADDNMSTSSGLSFADKPLLVRLTSTSSNVPPQAPAGGLSDLNIGKHPEKSSNHTASTATTSVSGSTPRSSFA